MSTPSPLKPVAAMAAGLAVLFPAAAFAAKAQAAAERCGALRGFSAPASAFALPTGGATVSEAVPIAADPAKSAPEYCRVRGAIAPAQAGGLSILYQVNLPTDWNRKTVQFGGGGLNGVVIEATGPFAGGGGAVRTALSRGYVTYGSDSGHQGADRSFYGDAQAFANYSHEAVKRSLDAMQALVNAYYGVAPRRNYHIGGSKGGQEALQAAQRYAADFDGVVAFYPASQNQSLQLGWNRMWHYAFEVRGGALNRRKQTLLRDAVMKACDGLDGARDGIVSNLSACRTTFDVAALKCPDSDVGGEDCLTVPQIAALRTAASPFTFAHAMPNGIDTVGPWPVLVGGDLDLWFGDGRDGSQQAFFQWPSARPEAMRATRIDLSYWRAEVLRTAAVYDASNPDLDGFKRRGGRLILVQGTTDMLVPYSMTDHYFQTLQKRYGEGLRNFVRYYGVPGYGHGRGAFTVQWDSLAALDAWVETGQAPKAPVVADGNPQRHRTRPLCEYPTWPRYRGSGSIDEAGSFTCVQK